MKTLSKKMILAGLVVAVIVIAAAVVLLMNNDSNNNSNDNDGQDDQNDTYIWTHTTILDIKLEGWNGPNLSTSGQIIGEPNQADWAIVTYSKAGGTFVDMFRVALYVLDSPEEAQDAFATKIAKGTGTTTVPGAFDQCVRYYPDVTHLYVFQYENVYGWVDYAINLTASERATLFTNIEEVLQNYYG